MKASIEKLLQKQSLSAALCEQAMQALFATDTPQEQIAAFLVLLRAKSETAEELITILRYLQQQMVAIGVVKQTDHLDEYVDFSAKENLSVSRQSLDASNHHGQRLLNEEVFPFALLDIVGTGGDGANTINISTGSAILAASCGVKIAKHGNRAVSSLSGSADVLEALGVQIDLTPTKVSQCIREVGIGFCYSPNFHPAMQSLRTLRNRLNVPTTFNILGPLLNPANASHFLLGVYDEFLLPVMAQVLRQIRVKRSLLVCGAGLDELSCVGKVNCIEVNHDGIQPYIIDPHLLGLPYCGINDLRGGDARMNAHILRTVFSGKPGAIANTLILNAAVALYLYGSVNTLTVGIKIAQDYLLSGKALTLLNNWIECSHA